MLVCCLKLWEPNWFRPFSIVSILHLMLGSSILPNDLSASLESPEFPTGTLAPNCLWDGSWDSWPETNSARNLHHNNNNNNKGVCRKSAECWTKTVYSMVVASLKAWFGALGDHEGLWRSQRYSKGHADMRKWGLARQDEVFWLPRLVMCTYQTPNMKG